jgi:hypothetical protein
MERITLTALKILVDSRLAKEDRSFKVLTGKFIVNVIMQEDGAKQRLVQLQSQMSVYEQE